jgi:hypothetical protein
MFSSRFFSSWFSPPSKPPNRVYDTTLSGDRPVIMNPNTPRHGVER